LPLKIGH